MNLLLPLLILLTVPQQQPKRFQCTVEGDRLTNCQYEDEEHQLKESFTVRVDRQWRLSLSRAVHGEGTAHFEETAKEICLRQVRPLDGFVRHPANEDLNLCQRKSKGWRVSNSRLGG